jgi:hypothetical protein
MNRLQQELQRLYGPPADGPGREQPKVRWMVLGVARPAEWAPLGAVWSAVQADLALPAPAVAVNGCDGFQLWFSLQAPVTVAQAWAFLDALRLRYLAEIAPARLALWPAPDAAGDTASDGASDVQADSASQAPPAGTVVLAPQSAWSVPALQAESGLWSAFVSPDLAPLCADEPWLDMPPNPEGQAQLLAPLKRISPADFEMALQRLRPVAEPALPSPTARSPSAVVTPQAETALDPKRFLQGVLNNESLDLALRIEAAKALLPYL